MAEIDMDSLGDPEKMLAEAEADEGKVTKMTQQVPEDDEDDKIVENALDNEEEDNYTADVQIPDDSKTLSEAEEKAQKRGWRPKEEYKGDPDKWVDAEEFNRQTPLHDTIAELSTRAKKTESAMNNLLKLFAKQEKEVTTHQLNEAKALRDDAIRQGSDPNLVAQYDAIISEKDNSLRNPAIQVEEDSPVSLPHENIHPLAKAYVEKNLAWWYADDAESKAKVAYASAREEQLAKQLGGRVPKIYQILESEIAARFSGKTSDEVKTERKPVTRAPGAEGVTRGMGGSGKTRSVGRADLDDDDRDTYDVIKRAGGDTKLFLQVLAKEGRIKQKG